MRQNDFSTRSSDGLLLHGSAWLPDADPKAVVCLVHGQGEHSARYAELATALTYAGFALLASDLRGHGRSAGPRGHTPSFDSWLDDLSLLLDEASTRFPNTPRFLYGHSTGGTIVLGYALRRRPPPSLRGVIASSPWLRLATTPPAYLTAAASALNRLWPSLALSSRVTPESLTRDPEKLRAIASDTLAHSRISSRMYFSANDTGRWIIEHAHDFPLPLLLMHGTGDHVTSHTASEEFASHAKGDVTLKLWPGFHHELQNEPERQDVFRYVVDWLSAHLPAPVSSPPSA